MKSWGMRTPQSSPLLTVYVFLKATVPARLIIGFCNPLASSINCCPATRTHNHHHLIFALTYIAYALVAHGALKLKPLYYYYYYYYYIGCVILGWITVNLHKMTKKIFAEDSSYSFTAPPILTMIGLYKLKCYNSFRLLKVGYVRIRSRTWSVA